MNDVSATFSNLNLTAGSTTAVSSAYLVTFLFGPQVTYRKNSKLQPFVRGLIGGARERNSTKVVQDGVLLATSSTNDTGVAFGAGAGVDVRMNHNLYLRAKVDFVRASLFKSTEMLIQAGGGIVYRFNGTTASW